MKRYIKKISIILMLICISIFMLSGCSSHCKASGCDNEIYKDNLCKTHYYLQQGVNKIEELIN